MINNVIHLKYNEIPQLSSKDKMYQSADSAYDGFYKYSTDLESFKSVIENRKKFKTNRRVLVDVLLQQYQGTPSNDKILSTIKSLSDENTFTITTAHQPVLFMGPLYMVYKILSTIHLCRKLKAAYPTNSFVPVFVSGGEDHDLEEVASMHIFNRDITWSTSQTGSVGRMSLNDLEKAIDELTALFGQTNYADELRSIIRDSFQSSQTYGQFNINLYKSLFSHLGLVVLNMDNKELKKEFIPYALTEIEEKISFTTVKASQNALAEKGIKEQAHVREINLFLFGEGKRERIIQNGDSYSIGSTTYSYSELVNIIQSNPGEVSPNVVMRPIYQELILPNLAYIGGGGEIAYWLERMNQFSSFNIPFPMLIRRNSALIVASGVQKNLNKVQLDSKDFFQSEDELIKLFLLKNTDEAFDLSHESIALNKFYQNLAEKAKSIDPSLEKYTLAEGAKQVKNLKTISSKMTKAAKAKNEVQLQKIQNIKSKLFPSGKLQERYDNFIPFYLKYGKEWFSELLEYMNPLNKDFIVIEE